MQLSTGNANLLGKYLKNGMEKTRKGKRVKEKKNERKEEKDIKILKDLILDLDSRSKT